MTAAIIDGRAIAAELRADLAGEVAELTARGVTPGLAAVLVGDDPGSVSYVTAKAEACAEIGIFSETIRLPADISGEALLDRIGELNRDPASTPSSSSSPSPRTSTSALSSTPSTPRKTSTASTPPTSAASCAARRAAPSPALPGA